MLFFGETSPQTEVSYLLFFGETSPQTEVSCLLFLSGTFGGGDCSKSFIFACSVLSQKVVSFMFGSGVEL